MTKIEREIWLNDDGNGNLYNYVMSQKPDRERIKRVYKQTRDHNQKTLNMYITKNDI